MDIRYMSQNFSLLCSEFMVTMSLQLASHALNYPAILPCPNSHLTLPSCCDDVFFKLLDFYYLSLKNQNSKLFKIHEDFLF